jgi:hypothetical protein
VTARKVRRAISSFALLAVLALIHQPAVGVIQLPSSPTVTIPGRIVVDGDGPVPDFGLGDARGPTLPLLLSLDTGPLDMSFTYQRDGSFLALLPPGRYSISLRVNIAREVVSFTYGGIDLSRSPVTVRADEPRELVLRLKPPPGIPAKVSGRVRDVADLASRGQNPKRVFASSRSPGSSPRGGGSAGSFREETDLRADGTFEFPKLFPGTYTIQVPNVTSPLSIDVAGRDIGNVVLNPLPPNPANEPYVPIAWRIQVEDGYPTPQFQANLTGPSTFSQHPVSSPPEVDGMYRTYVQKGEYRFRIGMLPPSYELKSIVSGATDLEKEPLKLDGPGPVVIVMNVAIAQPQDWLTLSGRVLGLANLPASLSADSVEVIGQASDMRASPARLRSDGTFEPRRVLPGDYRLALRARDADGSFPVVHVHSMTATKANNPAVEFRIPDAVPIRGRVTVDGNMPRPCPRLAVDGNPRTFTVQCQPDGTFTGSLPAGDYRLQAWGFPMGYYWIKSLTFGDIDLLQQNMRLPAGSSSEIVMALGTIPSLPTGSVRGRIVPVPTSRESRVLIASMRGGLFETAIRPDGSFEIPKLLTGDHRVRVIPDAPESQGILFTVKEGQTTEVEVPR